MDEIKKDEQISNETTNELVTSIMERQVRRLFILCIILFLALIGTNAYWIWNENQHMDTITITQDTPDGNNNYIGRDGDITNGTSNNND